MKKILKSRIFYFVLGLIVATTVGVSATILYQANEIGFTPQNPNWKVNNLESDLNDLYSNSNIKITTKITDIHNKTVNLSNNQYDDMYALLFSYTSVSNAAAIVNARTTIATLTGATATEIFSSFISSTNYGLRLYKLENCEENINLVTGDSGGGGAQVILFK